MTVYFIGSPTGHIKIGFTSGESTTDRLASLQTGSPLPLRLLAKANGDQATERRLHKQFAASRAEGEWFKAEPELLALVAYAKRYKTVVGWSGDSKIPAIRRSRR